jgi:alkanesulfonate monooxygenase SsuD/methylene tetrahydromethanopterin reductase-like flavin-dependent oxidoreductase (luciferase family)
MGHGVVLLPFNYNHPMRVAERVAALDIMSNGRVEFGSGRSTTMIELERDASMLPADPLNTSTPGHEPC